MGERAKKKPFTNFTIHHSVYSSGCRFFSVSLAVSLLYKPSPSLIIAPTLALADRYLHAYMYIYEWYKFGVKSLKYTRRIVVVYSRRKFCVERWGFDITGVKCLGMDFALITPLWARVSLPHPRNDSASNAYIIILIYCCKGDGILYRE